MPKKQWVQTTNRVYKKKNPLIRFMAKVFKKNNGCWIWQAGIRKADKKYRYGQFSLNGYPEWAHRASWILHYGLIPKGLLVCHTCDVSLCVNPDHLFLGTQSDNMQDMLQKERDAVVGEKNHASKLTRETVLLARKWYKEGKMYSAIAKVLQVNRQTVNDAINLKTWRAV